MTLSPNAFLSLSEVKDVLNIKQEDPARDIILTRWINWISDEIETLCQNPIKKRLITNELLSGDGTAFLYTNHYPILFLAGENEEEQLHNLQYRNIFSGPWYDCTGSLENIFIDKFSPCKIELLQGTFPRGKRNIKIQYYAGYETIPGELLLVVSEYLQMQWNNSKYGAGNLGYGSKSNNINGMSSTDSFRNLRPDWLERIFHYRKPSL